MSDAKRAAMAAHLFECAAKMAREGCDVNEIRIVGGVALSIAIGQTERAASEYVRALGFAGVPDREDRMECLASIERGEHPAGSLPARLTSMRAGATRRASEDGATERGRMSAGAAHAFDTVLEWLGVKP